MANNIRKYGKLVEDSEHELFVKYIPKFSIEFENEKTDITIESCEKYDYKSVHHYLINVRAQRNILKEQKHKSAELKNMGFTAKRIFVAKIKASIIQQFLEYYRLFPFSDLICFHVQKLKINDYR